MERALTAEAVVDGCLPSAPAVSPDGRWAVYVVAPMGQVGEHPSSELWLAAVHGGVEPRRVDVPTARLSSPQWAPDSASLFFLAEHAGTARLHRIGLDDGATREPTGWASGLLAYRTLADPELIAILSTDEPTDQGDVLVRGPGRPARLRLLDLRTGRILTPALFGDRHVADVVQRPDGGPLAVLTWSSPDLDPGLLDPRLHLLHVDTGQVDDLGPTPADARSPVWWHDGDWCLAYLALTPPGLQAGTAVFDLVPFGAHRNLTAGLAACPVELVQVDQGAPLVLVADGLDTAIHRLGPNGLTEVSLVKGQVKQLSANRDGTVVTAVVSGPHDPHDVHAGPVDGPLTRRTDTRPELRALRWGGRERLAYQAFDGLPLDGLLVLPPGRSRSDGPFPLVTIPHGGPYDRYADEFTLHWSPSAQWFAHAGYAVFLPNPRGGQGHGHDFAAAVAGAVGQEEWLDLTTGIDLLVAEGVADPDRLGIAGWSHGGFMAAWAVGQTDRFAAAVMGAGISDWGLQAATGEWGAFDAALGGSVGWEGVGPHQHDRVSPISYASSVRTPVLIVHGADDTNVPLSQAECFHHALRRFGVEHEFVVYPREGHSFRERGHQLDLLRRARAWFDRWLVPPDHRDDDRGSTSA